MIAIAPLLALLVVSPELQRGAQAIDRARLEAAVIALQADHSRVVGTAGERRAEAWLTAELDRLDLPVTRRPVRIEQVFDATTPHPGFDTENLEVHFGPTRGPQLFVVAHYDTKGANLDDYAARGWSWSSSTAPGADDNASGCAALLELARVIASAPAPRIGISLVWSAGEEMAIVDSRNWMTNIGAEALAEAAAKQEVLGAIAIDMLLRARPFGPSFRIYSDGSLGSSLLAEALALAGAAVEPGAELRVIVDPSFAWSDHGSFWARGLPGVLLIEDDFHHARYHRPSDRLGADGFYDLDQLLAGTRIAYAGIALLAYGPDRQ